MGQAPGKRGVDVLRRQRRVGIPLDRAREAGERGEAKRDDEMVVEVNERRTGGVLLLVCRKR